MNSPWDKSAMPHGLAGRLNPACDRFEEAWKAGQRPRLEDYLPEVAEADRSALVRELVRLELEYRVRAGEQPSAAEYKERLPGYAAVIEEAFAETIPGPMRAQPVDQVSTIGPREKRDPPLPDRVMVPGYELLGELGRGGMGVVYRARQISLGRDVAVKILLGRSEEPQVQARFEREASFVAGLDHPGIVKVFDFQAGGECPFVVMELCPGGSLSERLAGATLPAAEVVLLMIELTDAVDSAHQQGIVHRDLKPSNILLDSEGRLKVADFGLALRCNAERMTASGWAAGTLEYMPPEQAQGARVIGPEADIWSLGVILYEFLTGRLPFHGETPLATIIRAASEDPISLRYHAPDTPETLEAVCMKCLRKTPSLRYRTAGDLRRALERVLAEDRGPGGPLPDPLTAVPVGPIGLLQDYRLRWIDWVILVPLAVLFGGSVVAVLVVALLQVISPLW